MLVLDTCDDLGQKDPARSQCVCQRTLGANKRGRVLRGEGRNFYVTPKWGVLQIMMDVWGIRDHVTDPSWGGIKAQCKSYGWIWGALPACRLPFFSCIVWVGNRMTPVLRHTMMFPFRHLRMMIFLCPKPFSQMDPLGWSLGLFWKDWFQKFTSGRDGFQRGDWNMEP